MKSQFLERDVINKLEQKIKDIQAQISKLVRMKNEIDGKGDKTHSKKEKLDEEISALKLKEEENQQQLNDLRKNILVKQYDERGYLAHVKEIDEEER